MKVKVCALCIMSSFLRFSEGGKSTYDLGKIALSEVNEVVVEPLVQVLLLVLLQLGHLRVLLGLAVFLLPVLSSEGCRQLAVFEFSKFTYG